MIITKIDGIDTLAMRLIRILSFQSIASTNALCMYVCECIENKWLLFGDYSKGQNSANVIYISCNQNAVHSFQIATIMQYMQMSRGFPHLNGSTFNLFIERAFRLICKPILKCLQMGLISVSTHIKTPEMSLR